MGGGLLEGGVVETGNQEANEILFIPTYLRPLCSILRAHYPLHTLLHLEATVAVPLEGMEGRDRSSCKKHPANTRHWLAP